MGYQIYIGEACINVEWSERRARVEVEVVPHDALSNPTGKHNWIESGYNEWADFARRIGLHKMFYGMRDRNGDWCVDDEGEGHDDLLYTTQYAAPITEAHYRAFVKAKENYHSAADDKTLADDMVKLDFLIMWTKWALANCRYPTFYNG